MEKRFVVEKYLEAAKGKQIRIIIHNGYQMNGILKTYDDTAILLEDCKTSTCKLVFLRHISTIEP